jgi:predicted P-loop ATPase
MPDGQRWKLAVHLALIAHAEGKSAVDIALIYAGLGIAVCPAKPTPNEIPYRGIDKDFKAALISGKDAITDDAEIRRLWDKWPEALIWAPMGAQAGVFVLDVDALGGKHQHDGVAAWNQLEIDYGTATTRTHKTPGGGFHRLYLWRDDRPIGGKTGNLPPGIDVIGKGKGIILPGSRVDEGTWTVAEDWEPNEAPDWLFEVLLPGRGGKRAGAGRKGKKKGRPWPIGFGQVVLDEACEHIALRPGGVHDGRDRAVEIAAYVRGGAIEENDAREALRAAAGRWATSNHEPDYPDKIVRHFDWGLQGDNTEPKEPPGWQPGETNSEGYLTNERGHRTSIFPNLIVALKTLTQLQGAFTYDLFADQVMIERALSNWHTNLGSKFPKILTDADESVVNEIIQRSGLLGINTSTLHAAIVYVAMENAYHPVKKYLDGLEWDKSPRVMSWLHDCLGCELNDYTAQIGKMFLLQMVARIYEPGCKADYVLILEGPQGRMKSWALERLARPWFSDDLPDLRNKDAKQHLRGKWLIEIAELLRMQRADILAFKSYITRVTDIYRPPYGHNEISQPRQCVFSATTNQEHYFTDETGNRRSWPVKCGTISLDKLSEDRDQLFAEAVVMYRAGTQRWPGEEFETETIAPEQRARMELGAFDQRVANVVAVKETVTLLEVGDALGATSIPDWDRLQKILTKSMQRLGWIAIREYRAGERVRAWKRGPNAARSPEERRAGFHVVDKEDEEVPPTF